jgi:hypothetical protein
MERIELLLWAIAFGIGCAMLWIVYKKWGVIRESFQNAANTDINPDTYTNAIDVKDGEFYDSNGNLLSPEQYATNALVRLDATAGVEATKLDPVEGESGKYMDASGVVYDGPVSTAIRVTRTITDEKGVSITIPVADTNVIMTTSGGMINPVIVEPIRDPKRDKAQETCPVLQGEYKTLNNKIFVSENIPDDFTSNQYTILENAYINQYTFGNQIETTNTDTSTRSTPIAVLDPDPYFIRKTDPNYNAKMDILKVARNSISQKYNTAECSMYGFPNL